VKTFPAPFGQHYFVRTDIEVGPSPHLSNTSFLAWRAPTPYPAGTSMSYHPSRRH